MTRLGWIAAVVALTCAARAQATLVELHAPAMGTEVTIRIAAPAARHLEATRAIQDTFLEIERLESILSSYRSESEVSRINAAAGGPPVEVGAETLALIIKSIEIGDLTDGAFDITFGPLGALWDFRQAVVPEALAIESARGLVDYRRIEVDRDHGTVRLPVAGMRIGLGGIAKGYIVDRAADVLRGGGFHHFTIDAGGDLRAEGSRGEDPWRIGIQDPRQPGRVIATLPLGEVSVVTSGDYERFFTAGGVRYHHILDPDTGYPARGCQSVTIISRDTGIADALATGTFVLGPVEGLGLAERLRDVEALIVDADGRIHTTSGLVIETPPLAD